MHRRQKVGLGIVAALVMAPVLAYHIINIQAVQYYSLNRYSSSAAKAREKGVLIKMPVVTTPTVTLAGRNYAVRSAFIEQRAHDEYRFWLIKRQVKERRYRLVVQLTDLREGTPVSPEDSSATNWLTYNTTISFDDSPGDGIWLHTLEAPLPDTIRLAAGPASECCQAPVHLDRGRWRFSDR